MIKQVVKTVPPTEVVTVKEVLGSKFMVGVYANSNGARKLLMIHFQQNGATLSAVHYGYANNYLPGGEILNYSFACASKAADKMLEICEKVYAVDNWQEVADVAAKHDVKGF